ncbi:MAG TPA: DUF1858 domain-containing protein [Thermomicrobiales bacterium]|nr:DUF1858 domain-containing protein [Thermomicrobiales bacterium]
MRWRKDALFYVWHMLVKRAGRRRWQGQAMMVEEIISTDTNLDDLVTRYPQTVPVFLRHRMLCFGCDLARFESIGDACRIYGEPVERLLEELIEAIRTDDPSPTAL